QQLTFQDPRLAKTDSPSLWQSLSERQIFLISPVKERIGRGPAATVSIGVPDLHYFCNRGGKAVLPLYRDQQARHPNVTTGLLERPTAEVSRQIRPVDLVAYCFALVAHGGYIAMFWNQFEHSSVRIPLTADAVLFARVVELGRRLLWLQTYGERFVSSNRPLG